MDAADTMLVVGLFCLGLGMAMAVLLAWMPASWEEKLSRSRLGRRLERFGARVELIARMAYRLVRPAKGRRRAQRVVKW